MHSELEALGFPVGPLSDSFFYFVPVRELGMNGAAFQREMLREGIMVRDCASFGPAYTDYVRFCVKDPARNRKFVEAVHAQYGLHGRKQAEKLIENHRQGVPDSSGTPCLYAVFIPW